MFSEELTGILQATESASVGATMVEFASSRGFSSASLLVVREVPGGTRHLQQGEEWIPTAYVDYFRDEEAIATDPVMQRMKRSHLPLAWDQSHYVSSGHGGMWETMNQHGLSCGVMAVMHMSEGRHVVMGAEFNSRSLPPAPEVQRLAADLQMFVTYVTEATTAFPILETNSKAHVARLALNGHHGLSPRELDILNWTAAGKTAWEIGMLFSISEHTVNKHVQSICRKLDTVNKRMAVVRAIELGIVKP